MTGGYALPSWPPETPWEGYIFALLIPFILRFWLLRRPLLDLISVLHLKRREPVIGDGLSKITTGYR